MVLSNFLLFGKVIPRRVKSILPLKRELVCLATVGEQRQIPLRGPPVSTEQRKHAYPKNRKFTEEPEGTAEQSLCSAGDNHFGSLLGQQAFHQAVHPNIIRMIRRSTGFSAGSSDPSLAGIAYIFSYEGFQLFSVGHHQKRSASKYGLGARSTF